MAGSGGRRRWGAVEPSQRSAFGRSVEAEIGELLVERGLRLLGQNVRVGRDEIDLLALDQDVLVLVEVRARSNAPLSEALLSVRSAKVRALRRAAIALVARGEHRALRIDVVAVGVDGIEWIENAVDFSER